jgi:drug/metabolite transporter (DMT)-like permease
MELGLVLLALFSAFLHAAWNAVVKAQTSPGEVMTAQMILAAAIGVPGLLWTGLPPLHVWPFLFASTTLGTIAVVLLLRAYETAGFAIVYPAWRAMIVMVTVPASTLIVGERIGTTALAGVGLIGLALVVLALAAKLRQAPPSIGATSGGEARALGWTAVSAVFGAACLLSDAKGVRAAGSPWAYGICLSIANAIAMSWQQRRAGSPVAILKRWWHVALPAAAASMTSYLAILYVYANAPVAPAAALRDTSAVFALGIAVFVLRERLSWLQWTAVAATAAAVPLLRLG